MADPYVHAASSAKHFGGVPEDYIDIHCWFDDSKRYLSDFRHRALRHHAEGVAAAVEKFGTVRTTSDGRKVPVRQIGERHVKEDLGTIPSLNDWLLEIQPRRWMAGAVRAKIEIDLAAPEDGAAPDGAAAAPKANAEESTDPTR